MISIVSIFIMICGFAVSIGFFSLLFSGMAKIQNNEKAQDLLETPKENSFKISDELIIRLARHLNNSCYARIV